MWYANVILFISGKAHRETSGLSWSHGCKEKQHFYTINQQGIHPSQQYHLDS